MATKRPRGRPRIYGPRRQIPLRMSCDLYEALAREAKERGSTMTEVVNRLVREHLMAEEQQVA